MKKLLFFVVLAIISPICADAQERLNDTIIGGTRYALITGLSGSVEEYAEAFTVDEADLVADLNNRLRSIAAYQAGAVSCAIAAPLLLSYAYGGNPFGGIMGYEAKDTAMAFVGYGVAAASVACGVLSYCQLWTRKVYVNQDGIIIRLGKSTKTIPRQ